MIDLDAFLEYAKVFDHYYGTSRVITEKKLKTGTDVFLDIDWQGAQQIRKKMPQSRSIYILPPSKEELNQRLYTRQQDSEEIIKKRLIQSMTEMSHYYEYDYLIINNNFNTALNDLYTIIHAERLKMNYQKQKHADLITKLLSN